MTKTLRDLKPADTVFVVYKASQGVREITRIGRKYGYFREGFLSNAREERFDLDTGRSVDNDDNAYANGLGFDVYLSEEHYTAERDKLFLSASLYQRLEKCMDRRRGVMNLDPVAMQQIHSILDRHEEPTE